MSEAKTLLTEGVIVFPVDPHHIDTQSALSLTMINEILKILKFIFIASSLTVFILRFGGPSYTTFAERRTFMSTSKVNFDLTNPPAISVSLEKIRNFNLIENCIENSKEDYQEAVACIDREFDIKHLLDADQEAPIGIVIDM